MLIRKFGSFLYLEDAFPKLIESLFDLSKNNNNQNKI